jgi:hypothetical protein
MAIKYGTSYFPSLAAARKYYAPYGYSGAAITRKINSGEIHIGKPPLEYGKERCVLIDDGTRYAVEDSQ